MKSQRKQFSTLWSGVALNRIFRIGKAIVRLANTRLGYELGYAENLTQPTDLRKPDHCPRKPMTYLQRLYVRTFGLPDTVKQQQAREVFSILDKSLFSSVLDIGCAYGHYSIRIAKQYPNLRVKGFDVNEEQLNVGRLVKRKLGLKNLILEKRDICDGPINEKHDLVLLLQVIEHLKDDRMALKEIRKIVSDSGHLILTAPNLESPMIDWSNRTVTIGGHYRDGYTLEQLVQMITDAHFKIKEIKHLSGAIGQIIEKVETYAKINFSVLFPLVYPFLNYLIFFDDFLGVKTRKSTSGILVVAAAI
jgi:2-polyprenyl-3-methyl-5-hydroxy-6-metoxy-1,4-benzoquinol methylase